MDEVESTWVESRVNMNGVEVNIVRVRVNIGGVKDTMDEVSTSEIH